MTAAEVIVKSLEKHGVEYVFGIPGGAIEPLNCALHDSMIEVIVAKHEEGAAFMADGYARVSGNLGVCCATSGPGATNMITGLASSYADSIPDSPYRPDCNIRFRQRRRSGMYGPYLWHRQHVQAGHQIQRYCH